MKNKLEFSVGLFILFSLFCFFLIILKISDASDLFSVAREYKLVVIFNNIGNLKIKSKVTLCGVKIGYVSGIRLVKNKLNEYHAEVDLLLDLSVNFIPKDSVLSIFMTNLLGDNYIYIDLGHDEEYFKNGDTVFLTNQALIIEDLISKFAFKK